MSIERVDRLPVEQESFTFDLICHNCGQIITISVNDARENDALTNAITVTDLTRNCCSNPNYEQVS